MKLLIDIAISCSTLIVFSLLNIQGLVDGPFPSIINFIFSIIFILLWYGYGLLRGRKNNKTFLLFAMVFWMIGFLVITICIWLEVTPLWIIAFLYIGPMNGLNHFDLFRTHGFVLAVIVTLVPLIITNIGYITGKVIKTKKCECIKE